jgi:predicted phosphohydrolase
MRVVCISDTHLAHRDAEIEVPDGDLLIHAGDGTYRGQAREIDEWMAWLASLPHPRKVVIAGNHDRLFEERPGLARARVPKGIDYLQDSGIEIGGLRIWGAPWQPEFLEWAFNLPRGERLREKWALIPPGTDILVTHGPPMGTLDLTPRGEPVGCEELREAVARLRPKLHVFGHIHHAHGQAVVAGTRFVNASICDEDYLPTHPPILIDL